MTSPSFLEPLRDRLTQLRDEREEWRTRAILAETQVATLEAALVDRTAVVNRLGPANEALRARVAELESRHG